MTKMKRNSIWTFYEVVKHESDRIKSLKSNGDDAFYDASQFQLLLQVERKDGTVEKPFILMLVDLSAVPSDGTLTMSWRN